MRRAGRSILQQPGGRRPGFYEAGPGELARATRFRPPAFAEYRARSALAIRSATDPLGSWDPEGLVRGVFPPLLASCELHSVDLKVPDPLITNRLL